MYKTSPPNDPFRCFLITYTYLYNIYIYTHRQYTSTFIFIFVFYLFIFIFCSGTIYYSNTERFCHRHPTDRRLHRRRGIPLELLRQPENSLKRLSKGHPYHKIWSPEIASLPLFSGKTFPGESISILFFWLTTPGHNTFSLRRGGLVGKTLSSRSAISYGPRARKIVSSTRVRPNAYTQLDLVFG